MSQNFFLINQFINYHVETRHIFIFKNASLKRFYLTWDEKVKKFGSNDFDSKFPCISKFIITSII